MTNMVFHLTEYACIFEDHCALQMTLDTGHICVASHECQYACKLSDYRIEQMFSGTRHNCEISHPYVFLMCGKMAGFSKCLHTSATNVRSHMCAFICDW